jgi:hypothetical protein
MALDIPRIGALELVPKIRTILLDPEFDRLCVVWVGEHVAQTPTGPGTIAKIRFQAKWNGASGTTSIPETG